MKGTVHGIGIESKSGGQFLAQHTGREFIEWDSSDKFQVGMTDIVVCTTDQVTPTLMSKLYVTSVDDGVPGLVCASDQVTIDNCCRNIVTRTMDRRAKPLDRIFISARAPFKSVREGRDLKAGGLERAEMLIDTMRSAPALLVINGPSNGFALGLSLRQYACTFSDLEPNGAKALLPSCQRSGRCNVFPTSPKIAEATEKKWLIPLSALRAEIGILYGCTCLRVYDNIFDPAYGIAEILLLKSQFGALITTWRPEFAPNSTEHLNSLVNNLSRGIAAGVAVQKFNRSAFATQFGVKLCLLGDPCCKLQDDSDFAVLPERSFAEYLDKTGKAPKREVDPQKAEARLLIEAVTEAVQYNRRADHSAGTALLEKLKTYLQESRFSDENESDKLDILLLQFVRMTPLLDSLFGSQFKIVDMSEDAICPACLSPARTFRAVFTEYAAKELRVISCSCCYDSLCIPPEWNVSLDLRDSDKGLISIHNVPEGARVVVCLLSHPSKDVVDSYEWPVTGNSRLPFDLPGRDEPFSGLCQIIIARHLVLGTVGFKLRSTPSGWVRPSTKSQ